jgi:hypothetical protein
VTKGMVQVDNSQRFPAFDPALEGLHPGVDLPPRFCLRDSVPPLNGRFELFSIAANAGELAVGELAPVHASAAFEVFPVSLDSIPCSCQRYEATIGPSFASSAHDFPATVFGLAKISVHDPADRRS